MGGIVGLLDDLPGRYRGPGPEPPGQRVRIVAGRATRDVVISGEVCSIEPADGLPPAAEIVTDAVTWRAIHEGRLSGIEAFAQRRLHARGSLEASLRFETLFERPDAGGLRYTLERVGLGGVSISVLVTGPPDAEPLLLLHGLGATKASWLTVIPALAREHRVIAVDLPGFGASDKPNGRYDAPWFAIYLFALLDHLGHGRARVAGNSMGGRIAMEMAMLAPERISGIACLAPAAAFAKRPGLWLVKLARPELGYIVSRVPRGRIEAGIRRLFADPRRLEDDWYRAAADDFLQTWGNPRARSAFFKALRNIYLDEPFGERGFWTRLAAMSSPALFVYGADDPLITTRFGEKVRATAPHVQVETWDVCGHVPQIEYPERTARVLGGFFARS